MGNPEHVEIVKKGREAIAKRREHHPTERLDLRGADLLRADLSGADLSGADLSGGCLYGAILNAANLNGADLREAKLFGADLIGADMRAANLTRADLAEADLQEANLCGADLKEANLAGANLRMANMSKADLSGAQLHEASLRGINLNGADLREAVLFRTDLARSELSGADFANSHVGRTDFVDVDLSDAKNLETVDHESPSTVGVDTLFKSKGRIPEAFLRGCGVPEVLIEYLPTLIGALAPIQFYSCFISYSGRDDDFARRLHARLQAEKLRVWFAPEDMRGGRKSDRQIDEAIRLHDRLLLVLSEHSMNSEWVKREIKKARKKEKETGKDVLFPIALVPYAKIQEWECLDHDTGEDLAQIIREFHIPTNFSKWKTEDEFGKAFPALMRDLRKQDDSMPNS